MAGSLIRETQHFGGGFLLFYLWGNALTLQPTIQWSQPCWRSVDGSHSLFLAWHSRQLIHKFWANKATHFFCWEHSNSNGKRTVKLGPKEGTEPNTSYVIMHNLQSFSKPPSGPQIKGTKGLDEIVLLSLSWILDDTCI